MPSRFAGTSFSQYHSALPHIASTPNLSPEAYNSIICSMSLVSKRPRGLIIGCVIHTDRSQPVLGLVPHLSVPVLLFYRAR